MDEIQDIMSLASTGEIEELFNLAGEELENEESRNIAIAVAKCKMRRLGGKGGNEGSAGDREKRKRLVNNLSPVFKDFVISLAGG